MVDDNLEFGPEDALTDEERDDSLTAVALARLALHKPDSDEELHEMLTALLEDRDYGELIELIWMLSTLSAALTNSWWRSLAEDYGEEFADMGIQPDFALDAVRDRLIASPRQEMEE